MSWKLLEEEAPDLSAMGAARFRQGFFVRVDIASASHGHSPSQTLVTWDRAHGLRTSRPA